MKLFPLLCLLLLPIAASAQPTTAVPQTQAEITYSFAPVVKKAAPAVVNIFTKRVVRVSTPVSPFMNDPFFRQFFGGSGMGAMPRNRVEGSLGSGVIVSADGLVVTSNHVIKGAQDITVGLADRRELKAKIIVADPQSDLALLRIEEKASPLPYLQLRDSDTVEVGDLVLALGNPFGVGQTVTSGIISAVARAAATASDYQFFLQTDAAINPGNSGGALVDMEGRLLGINTAIYSTSGGSNGVGFAIPANMVKALITNQNGDGKIVRPFLPVTVQPVTQEIAESLGMPAPRGVLIKKADSKTGLQVGDVILSVSGVEVNDEAGLRFRTATGKINSTTDFLVRRGGKEISVPVALTPPQENPARDIRTIKGRNPLGGLRVANLSPALATELGLDIDATGVIVLDDSDGGTIGSLHAGDIILNVNGTDITSTKQLEKLMEDRTDGWRISFGRGGTVLTLLVRS